MTDNDLIDLALNQPLSSDRFKPRDLHIDREKGLRIEWADGHVSRFTLTTLRKRCPCATCRNERGKPKPAAASRSLTVLPADIGRATEFNTARVVGNYAIQIEWADGHKTGIYDFRYLRMMSGTDEAAPAGG
ncbi:MAG: DUF971 domain-containing protein [Phycisphaerae bacterium]